ncbi:IS200/IS605 family element RNA-guided endonuclease TnpB [Acidaminococcus sp. AM05-11]|uniref:IS200/IS605 family element RNA-guided endonuclease TnpB n=1 Tax=Acidaminococcus sp. AM05-11 TaxID=2291997 RepID=UPI0018F78DD9|nr:IS200/IS605 family element RNA-guided endonuclease TnpB [Acidaminococcus sp. AM05-11]
MNPTLITDNKFSNQTLSSKQDDKKPFYRGYKYRIYPNKAQQKLIEQTINGCFAVYNYFLEVRERLWEKQRQRLTYTQMAGRLSALKKTSRFSFLKEADSMALQEVLRDLDTAFENFLRKRANYPRVKGKRGSKQKYRTRNQNHCIRIVDGKLRLPRLGLMRIKLHRSFEGRICFATIQKTATGKYFVSLCVEQERELLQRSNRGGEVGIDVGLEDFYTDSNGDSTANPHILKKYQKQIAREQSRLSRTTINSRNWKKRYQRLARIHEKITNARKDFLHKQSIQLVRENELIAVEYLKIKNMMTLHTLAKAIADVSWREFFWQLEYKGAMHGTKIIKIPTYFPSSQICHVCGYINYKVKNLSIRNWTCPHCHTENLDRDTNAAINILARAKKFLKN